MKNSVALVWLNNQAVLSVKRLRNPSSIYFSPVRYLQSGFWKHVLSWLRDSNVLVGTMDESDLIFGKFNIVNDFIFINHILLLGKYYIYIRRCLNSVPTLRGFIARTRCVYNIKLHIAREKNKPLAHFKKWEKLINAII